MKSVGIISILALLILFPLISYLYLKWGYNFRLEALQELEPKGEIQIDPTPFFLKQDTFQNIDFEGRVTIAYNGSTEFSSMVEPIFEEFSHREEFLVLSMNSDSSINNEILSKFNIGDQWVLLNADYPMEKDLALIDTAGVIRNYYNVDSLDFKNLGKHIPIVLPRKKEEDIVMKKRNRN